MVLWIGRIGAPRFRTRMRKPICGVLVFAYVVLYLVIRLLFSFVLVFFSVPQLSRIIYLLMGNNFD